MLSDAIEYPLEGDDAMRTLAVGGGLSLASGIVGFVGALLFLIPIVGWVLGPLAMLAAAVPSVLLGGYSVAVSRSVMAGRTAPPAFTDWGRYLRDGLAVLAIALLYSLPAVVLGVVGVAVFALASLLPDEVGGVLVLLVSLVGAVAAFAYSLAFGYVFPAALVNYARTDAISAAWDADTLRTVLLDRDYAVAWLLGWIALTVAQSAGSTLAWILIGFGLYFYGQVVAVYLYTRGVVDALGGDVEPAVLPAQPSGTADEGMGTVGTDGLTPDEPAAASTAGDDGAVEGNDEAAGGNDVTVGEEGDGPVEDDEGSDDDDETAGDDEGPDGKAPGEPDRDLVDVIGVGPTTAESLRAAGYETVADLRAATREALTEVEGIGPAKADRIKDDVGDA